jgi:hypothetical protein
MPELIKAVQDLEWELPRDIQAECIPLILGGGDILAVMNELCMKTNVRKAAETGSGKTGVRNTYIGDFEGFVVAFGNRLYWRFHGFVVVPFH